jgi:hypothetical protein
MSLMPFGAKKKSAQEIAAEEAKKQFEEDEKKRREEEGDAYCTVVLNSSAFRGEGSVHVHATENGKFLTDIAADGLVEPAARTTVMSHRNTSRGSIFNSGGDAAATPGDDDFENQSQPLLKGVSPNAFVYRLSNVYDRFPDASVGRIQMRVPTVRSRSQKQKSANDEGGRYTAVNALNAQVTCRDIPGLNWYVPNTKIQVPSSNLHFKYSSMYSHILKGQGRSRYSFVITRAIQVVSIFGVAAAGAAKKAGKAAMGDATAKMEAAAEAEAEKESAGPIKQLEKYLFPTSGLQQAGVLAVATLLNFAVAFKKEWDEADNTADMIAAMSGGEVWIYFSEFVLLSVLFMATPEFPFSVKALWKEEISALVLIAYSALTIIILNLAFFYKMFFKAIAYIRDLKMKAKVWIEQAKQQWAVAKMVFFQCTGAIRIVYSGTKGERKELKAQIWAKVTKTALDICPFLDTLDEMRVEHGPMFCQRYSDGGWCCL